MENEEKFIKGFNSGYQLAKHEPELFDKLMKSLDSNSDYIQGLNMGKKQHDREQLLAQVKRSTSTRKKSRGLD